MAVISKKVSFFCSVHAVKTGGIGLCMSVSVSERNFSSRDVIGMKQLNKCVLDSTPVPRVLFNVMLSSEIANILTVSSAFRFFPSFSVVFFLKFLT